MLIQQSAYILHARPWRETSLLLECLTVGYGRVGMVARGVRKPRAHLSQSQLQPFQPLQLSWVQRGELGTLRAAEPESRCARLTGQALLSGLYVNELVVRLCGRDDPNRALFALYGTTLARLADGDSLAWTLRRFERDFLAGQGYAMALRFDAVDGAPLQPEAEYQYVPEQGAMPAAPGGGLTVRGADLLAWDADVMPDAAALRRLRHLSRGVLLHHLDGMPLRSWRVLTGRPATTVSRGGGRV